MSLRLDAKVAIITGAGSGIGAAIAARFCDEGATVVAADIAIDRAEAVAREIRHTNLTIEAAHVDASDSLSVSNLVTATFATYGRLDIAVANAGGGGGARTAEECDPEEWDRVLALNLKGPFLLAKHSIPYLRQTGGGVIVNMSSVNAFWAEREAAPYCAAKAGVVALTRSIAIDYGAFNIRCVAICPGYIDTPMAKRFFQQFGNEKLERERRAQLHALGRIGAAHEVASLAAFLASEDASFCSGQAFIVDGGLTSGLVTREG